MPPVLRAISYLIPLRYYLIIIRSILLKGVGLESLLPEVLVLILMAFAWMAVAALRFRKRLD